MMPILKAKKEGISVPALVDAKFILHELEELTDILDDASVRLHVLEYHLAQLEAHEIVAGAVQTSASRQYTVDKLAGMVSTYFDSPLQMAALWSMFGSNDPVQQRDAVRCVLAAKRTHEAKTRCVRALSGGLEVIAYTSDERCTHVRWPNRSLRYLSCS